MSEITINTNYFSVPQKQEVTAPSLLNQKSGAYLKKMIRKTIFFQIWVLLKEPVI